jgi:hypothetical protein
VLQQAPKILRPSGLYPLAVTKWGFSFLPRFSQGCHKREALPTGIETIVRVTMRHARSKNLALH